MQDFEHGIVRKFTEIGFAIQRVDGAEPLSQATVVADVVLRVLEKLRHFNQRHCLAVKVNLLFLIFQLHRMAVIWRFRERVKELSVVVEIHVPVFVLFDKGVDVLPVIVCVPEFAEKLSKIVSFHYFFLNRGTAPEKRIESCPYLYIYTLF